MARCTAHLDDWAKSDECPTAGGEIGSATRPAGIDRFAVATSGEFAGMHRGRASVRHDENPSRGGSGVRAGA